MQRTSIINDTQTDKPASQIEIQDNYDVNTTTTFTDVSPNTHTTSFQEISELQNTETVSIELQDTDAIQKSNDLNYELPQAIACNDLSPSCPSEIICTTGISNFPEEKELEVNVLKRAPGLSNDNCNTGLNISQNTPGPSNDSTTLFNKWQNPPALNGFKMSHTSPNTSYMNDWFIPSECTSVHSLSSFSDLSYKSDINMDIDLDGISPEQLNKPRNCHNNFVNEDYYSNRNERILAKLDDEFVIQDTEIRDYEKDERLSEQIVADQEYNNLVEGDFDSFLKTIKDKLENKMLDSDLDDLSLSNVTQCDTYIGPNLIINYLPITLSRDRLYDLFSHCGNITAYKLVHCRYTGISLGYGFIRFDTIEGAQRAIELMQGFEIEGKRLKVSVVRSNSQSKWSNLFVTCLPFYFTSQQVYDLLSTCGEIVTWRLLINKHTGKSRCKAFVRFDRKSDAERAIREFNGLRIPGHWGDQKLCVALAFHPRDKYPRNRNIDTMNGAEHFISNQNNQPPPPPPPQCPPPRQYLNHNNPPQPSISSIHFGNQQIFSNNFLQPAFFPTGNFTSSLTPRMPMVNCPLNPSHLPGPMIQFPPTGSFINFPLNSFPINSYPPPHPLQYVPLVNYPSPSHSIMENYPPPIPEPFINDPTSTILSSLNSFFINTPPPSLPDEPPVLCIEKTLEKTIEPIRGTHIDHFPPLTQSRKNERRTSPQLANNDVLVEQTPTPDLHCKLPLCGEPHIAFIYNLPKFTTNHELYKLCLESGSLSSTSKVYEVQVAMECRSKAMNEGEGFVTMETYEDANIIIKTLNGFIYKNNVLYASSKP